MPYSGKMEYAEARKMRESNTRVYRLAHWPIWIWVFFLAPGPLTFSTVCAWLRAGQSGVAGGGDGGHRDRRAARAACPGVEPRRTFCASMRTSRIRCIGGCATRLRGTRC